MRVPHYLSGVEGSGNFSEVVIKGQFGQILECILNVLKSQDLEDDTLYVHLLNALCWDYSSEDH